RRALLSSAMGLDLLADLGWEILEANVQVAAYTLRDTCADTVRCIDARSSARRDDALRAIAIDGVTIDREVLQKLPNAVLAYALPPQVLQVVAISPYLSDRAVLPRGLGSNDADRTYRFWVEVDISDLSREGRWQPLANGGDYSPFFRADLGVALWRTKEG